MYYKLRKAITVCVSRIQKCRRAEHSLGSASEKGLKHFQLEAAKRLIRESIVSTLSMYTHGRRAQRNNNAWRCPLVAVLCENIRV